jgi:hypothetical protein
MDSEKLKEIKKIFLEYIGKYNAEKTKFIVFEESLAEDGIFTEKVLGLGLKESVTYKIFDTAFSKRKIFHQTSVFDSTTGMFAYEITQYYKIFKEVMKRFNGINLSFIEEGLYLKYFTWDYVVFNIFKNLENYDDFDKTMFFVSKAKRQFVIEMERQIKRYETGETYISETFSYAEKFLDLLSDFTEGLSGKEKEIILKYVNRFDSKKIREFKNTEFYGFLKGRIPADTLKKTLNGISKKEYLKLYGKYKDLIRETDTGFEMNEKKHAGRIEPSEFLKALKTFTFEKMLGERSSPVNRPDRS